MSYPSIKQVITNAEVDIESSSEKELNEVLFSAFQKDLPEGVSYILKIAKEVKSGNNRVLKIEDPNSKLGKQLIRLVGTDIAKGIMEEKTGVALGMYNCCGLVAAPSKKLLLMNAIEQIKLQNGVFASADC
ncbi:hypothetical protein FJZ21_00770 [Candidatus Pacearchaeota archaeon]|nr:hypothetical protein [Candidatus Pacearchaeota archaeon]